MSWYYSEKKIFPIENLNLTWNKHKTNLNKIYLKSVKKLPPPHLPFGYGPSEVGENLRSPKAR